jgi:hypothetical protein
MRDLDGILIDKLRPDYDTSSEGNKEWNWGPPGKQGEGGKYFCNNEITNPKYVVDNAAVITDSEREKNVFCPLSSIIDGMFQCTIGTKGGYNAGSVEYGNMNFNILDSVNNVYYKGKLNLNDDFNIASLFQDSSGRNSPSTAGTVTYRVSYQGMKRIPVETSVENIPIKKGKIQALEAHNILKNTLVSILRVFIELLSDPTSSWGQYLTTSTGNIFQNMINVVVNPSIQITLLDENLVQVPPELQNRLIQAFFTILGKGSGDIFQEINVVCKYGGYTSGPFYLPENSSNIVQWNSDGNAKRFFTANDRPSGVRCVFLITYGKIAQINNWAYGGYKSKNDTLFAKRSSGPVCAYGNRKRDKSYPREDIIVGGGGFIKHKYTSKMYRHKKKTKRKHNNKVKKRSKKNKYIKRHKKTHRNNKK